MGNQVTLVLKKNADVSLARGTLTAKLHRHWPLFYKDNFVSHYAHADTPTVLVCSTMCYQSYFWDVVKYDHKSRSWPDFETVYNNIRKHMKLKSTKKALPLVHSKVGRAPLVTGEDYFVFGILTDYLSELERADDIWDEVQKLVNGQLTDISMFNGNDQRLEFVGAYSAQESMVIYQNGNCWQAYTVEKPVGGIATIEELMMEDLAYTKYPKSTEAQLKLIQDPEELEKQIIYFGCSWDLVRARLESYFKNLIK